jgi:CheY-like chemotaxis protein
VSNVRKILLVDGDPAVRKSFEQVLSGKGHAVITASSGEDALWKLGDGTCDAVFTEIVLRGMSGLDLAEEIHTRQPSLPVVIITGYGSGTAQERAAAAGVAEFLHKPLSPEQLADTAKRVLQATESVVASQAQTPVVEVAPAQPSTKPAVLRIRNVVLFLLAPFIGLFYILAFPVIGLGMLASLALSTETQEPEEAEPLHATAPANLRILKTVAMMLVATVIGIAYAVVIPIMGIGLLLWLCLQAWGKLGAKVMRT